MSPADLATALGVMFRQTISWEKDNMPATTKVIKRLQDIENLEAGEKEYVFAMLDAFLSKNKMQGNFKIT